MNHSRRQFLGSLVLSAAALSKGIAAEGKPAVASNAAAGEPVIDIHQHTHYHGRSHADLVKHQRNMGVTQTILLPAGMYYGLDAQCGGNESCREVVELFPQEYLIFANELPYMPQAREVITSFLKKGAIGIGEQKFRVMADSRYLALIASIAKEFGVPVLLHFWDGDYNMELGRFHKTLEKFPEVNFIGHAQSWWGNIDKAHKPEVAYPKGPVTPGGITDRLLADYPNMFGDLSAGSGLNALRRDEDFTRDFLKRHQDKLLFGSDCEDVEGKGEKCTGAQIIATVRKLSGSREIERKLLYRNATRILKLKPRE